MSRETVGWSVPAPLASGLWKLLLLFAAGLACASCVPIEPAPLDDYLGPVGGEWPAAPRAAAPPGPLDLTVDGAILLGLENNAALRVERYNPPAKRTFEDQERAVFDPVLSGDVSGSSESGRAARRSAATVGAGVSKLFPTGTGVEVGLETDLTRTGGAATDTTTRAGLTVTQALLRGAGLDVNLARLRQARLDTRTSEYELRGFAQSLIAEIEATYWDYALAKRQIEIYEESLALAERQLEETRERIKVGKLAEVELAAAQAEVALRREGLINARSTLETARLRLLRLTNPPGGGLWQREFVLRDQPVVRDAKVDDVESHAAVALRLRPDLNQARLGVQRGDLEIVKTRNGLLPKMDLFITLGKTGYAGSFGDSASDLNGKGYDVSAGLLLEYPLGNRDADARHRRALLSREQAAEAVRNLAQLVQVDVRSAHIEVRRLTEQVSATAATRKFQEENARAETEKFRVGKSTTLLVAAVQRDLLASRIAEIQAVVNHLKARVDLFRIDGSLLERRGVQAPGREPVDLPLPTN